MNARRAVAIALFAAAATLAIAGEGSARAGLDPSAAQAAVEAARAENDYAFCRGPRVPLSGAARELCDHAAAIPSCAGFAAACDAKAPPLARCVPRGSKDEPSPSDSPDWSDRLRFLSAAARGLLWVLVAAVAALVVTQIVFAVRRARRDRSLADEAPPVPIAAASAVEAALDVVSDEEALLRRGDRHAEAGEGALALHFYLKSALQSLDRRGALRVGRDRTNGEYLRTCTDGDARPLLHDLIREVERVQFGREDASAEAVAVAARRAAAIVRSLGAAALVLALVGLAACGDDPCVHFASPGEDPAGGELFSDLMQKQGLRVAPLGRALATLGPQEWWRTTSAAVVVDAERVDLDLETREHLGEWIGAGGVALLAGAAGAWPSALDVRAALAPAQGALSVALAEDDDADDDDAARVMGGALVRPQALELPSLGRAVAWSGEGAGAVRAGVVPYGKGRAVVLASDELLTNAALARPGNAAALTAILTHLGRTELLVAQPDDGVSPPSSPLTSLTRAGLGLGLAHALAAVFVLFAAVGARLVMPRPSSPPARRAFSEHVRAVGGLYARTSNGAHALAAYARFAEERLRARMPRGATDVAAFLAARSNRSLDECRRLWARGSTAREGGAPQGDELAVLQQLSAIVIAATAPATPATALTSPAPLRGANSHEDP